jgi:transcriptional regulator with XRE-family HTH domain
MRRKSLKIRQVDLANELGISYQQVQKYENGSSRITASQLLRLSRVLDAPIDYFFDSITDEGSAEGGPLESNALEWLHSTEARQFANVISAASSEEKTRILAIAQLLVAAPQQKAA